MSRHLAIHQRAACRISCEQHTTCMYYQFAAANCYICIQDPIQYTSASLIPVQTAVPQETSLKIGVEDFFTNTTCKGYVYRNGDLEDYRYDYYTDRVTDIQFCASLFYEYGVNSDLDQITAGFQLYLNGISQPQHGCYISTYPFDLVSFPSDEVVLMVGLYMGYSGYLYGLRAIEFHTNKGMYGPVGSIGTSTFYAETGYNFVGFSGWAGVLVDQVGVNWQYC